MQELGRLPQVGDEVAIDSGVFRIERLDGRRIDRIRYTPNPVGEDTLGSSAGADRRTAARTTTTDQEATR